MLLRQSNCQILTMRYCGTVVVVEADVNLLILFGNVLIIAMPSCVNLELVIFTVPFNRLNGFHNTSTSILKERHSN